MTRREVLSWLDTRRPAPPAVLRAHLEATVTDRAEPLPDHLAALGGALLARGMATPAGGRGAGPQPPGAGAVVPPPVEGPGRTGWGPRGPPGRAGRRGGGG